MGLRDHPGESDGHLLRQLGGVAHRHRGSVVLSLVLRLQGGSRSGTLGHTRGGGHDREGGELGTVKVSMEV